MIIISQYCGINKHLRPKVNIIRTVLNIYRWTEFFPIEIRSMDNINGKMDQVIWFIGSGTKTRAALAFLGEPITSSQIIKYKFICLLQWNFKWILFGMLPIPFRMYRTDFINTLDCWSDRKLFKTQWSENVNYISGAYEGIQEIYELS